jgi:hypothetical protein
MCRCGVRKLPEGMSRCLKCSLSERAYDDMGAGECVTAFEKHPTIMRKMVRGVSRLTTPTD